MLDYNNLVALGKATAKASKNNPVAYSFNGENYSYDQLDSTFRQELNELIGTPALYRENCNTFFALVEEVITDVLPAKVAKVYEGFATVKVLGQGEAPIFRRKLNQRTRAKQFITRVGLAGVYEVFKLGGSESFEVKTSAIGGAAQIGVEELLDGRVDWAELVEIVMEGIEDTIQSEVGEAMKASIAQLPTANSYESNSFVEEEFDRLIAIANSYGKAVIYCDALFASKLIPSEARMTENMKNTLWERGHLLSYKTTPIVVLPNGVKDESNTAWVNDPGYCWIIPTGGNSTPAYIAMEGNTLVDERKNADWSKEIQVYKKVGVGVMMTNDICVYHDTSLTTTL